MTVIRILRRHYLYIVLMACCYSRARTVCSAFQTTYKPQKDIPIASRLEQKPSSSASSLSSSSTMEMPEKEVTKDGVYIVNKMPPPLPTQLKNTYYMLRHGQSWGNVEEVISSARSLANSEKHGLTPLGQEQGKESAKNLLNLLQEKQERGTTSNDIPSSSSRRRRLFFYSSPFARARQTAQACIDGFLEEENGQLVEKMNLDVQTNIILEDGIMERFFGRLDDGPLETYGYIWPVDMVNVTHTEYDVESVAAVSTRLHETILKIDTSPLHETPATPSNQLGGDDNDDNGDDDIIVLVSHADVLQIAQLYAADIENVGHFSSYRFTNGEVREMALTADSLPDPQPLERPESSD